MFPLNWNIPFIRKNGSRTTLGNIIENANSELPPHSVGDAGKLLGVKADGSVEWSNTVTNNVDVLIENGAVNLSPNNLVSQTANGITFVVNDDKSISASGTCTGNIRLDIGTITLKKDLTYRISDSADGKTSGNDKCQMIGRLSGGTWVMVSSNAEPTGNTYTPDADTDLTVTIAITNGTTVNTTLYPMIVNAEYLGDYVPYAMTNKELTEEKLSLSDLKTVVATSSDFADFKTKVAAL